MTEQSRPTCLDIFQP